VNANVVVKYFVEDEKKQLQQKEKYDKRIESQASILNGASVPVAPAQAREVRSRENCSQKQRHLQYSGQGAQERAKFAIMSTFLQVE
jgi:hypothetical protein